MIKAAIDSQTRFLNDKKGSLNEGLVECLVFDKRILTSTEIASVVETSAMKAVAKEESIEALAKKILLGGCRERISR